SAAENFSRQIFGHELVETRVVFLPDSSDGHDAGLSARLAGGLLWDDDANIASPELRSLDGLRQIWFQPGATQQYYPLLYSSFWLQQRLWGDSPTGYHLANLFLHIGCVVLVLKILRLLRIPGAELATIIFALHPVNVETVAWITERKNTL